MSESNIQKVLLKYNIPSVLTDSGIGLQDEDEAADTSSRNTADVTEVEFLSCPREGTVVFEGCCDAPIRSDGDAEAARPAVGAGALPASGPRVSTLESRGGFKRPPPARVQKRARGEPPGLDGGAISRQHDQSLQQHEQHHQHDKEHQTEEGAISSIHIKQQRTCATTLISSGGTSKTDNLSSREYFLSSSLVQLPPHPRSDYSHAGTLTEINNNSCAEIELVSLIEEQIPRYKLRADTITNFAGRVRRNDAPTPRCLDLQDVTDMGAGDASKAGSFMSRVWKRSSRKIDSLTRFRNLDLAS
ncbi:hypothetical protein BIW11_01414 [Tropilaelaps mercedesae]|uniref:Uncharacterized protein n=1 Tax=Tropilaelaps mercedesae TaxID=418985 RepID=A0A1V9XEV9_9ACAR|nr:hypothetical protein BIW11_01414 [Tropilaelaps mercedesae]